MDEKEKIADKRAKEALSAAEKLSERRLFYETEAARINQEKVKERTLFSNESKRVDQELQNELLELESIRDQALEDASITRDRDLEECRQEHKRRSLAIALDEKSLPRLNPLQQLKLCENTNGRGDSRKSTALLQINIEAHRSKLRCSFVQAEIGRLAAAASFLQIGTTSSTSLAKTDSESPLGVATGDVDDWRERLGLERKDVEVTLERCEEAAAEQYSKSKKDVALNPYTEHSEQATMDARQSQNELRMKLNSSLAALTTSRICTHQPIRLNVSCNSLQRADSIDLFEQGACR